MNQQSRIYVTLSPRMRKALELCANLDGSSPASYAALVLSTALVREIERSPVLSERWLEMEREALLSGDWGFSPETQQDQVVRKETKVHGWILAGSHPEAYEYGTEKRSHEQKCGYLRSKDEWDIDGFGTLMQSFKADKYRDQRLRYSAQVKAEKVESWAGLWMRVDGPSQRRVLAFDNMQSRPIQGTTDWQSYEVVLDVPQEGVDIAFGILLHGPGRVWISDIQFDVVDADTPITRSRYQSDQPVNLDFTV